MHKMLGAGYLSPTGSSQADKVANIYDLAGNISEMTTEVVYNDIMKSEYVVNRSGTMSYSTRNDFTKVPAVRSSPYYGGRDYNHAYMGFRVALIVR